MTIYTILHICKVYSNKFGYLAVLSFFTTWATERMIFILLPCSQRTRLRLKAVPTGSGYPGPSYFAKNQLPPVI